MGTKSHIERKFDENEAEKCVNKLQCHNVTGASGIINDS